MYGRRLREGETHPRILFFTLAVVLLLFIRMALFHHNNPSSAPFAEQGSSFFDSTGTTIATRTFAEPEGSDQDTHRPPEHSASRGVWSGDSAAAMAPTPLRCSSTMQQFGQQQAPPSSMLARPQQHASRLGVAPLLRESDFLSSAYKTLSTRSRGGGGHRAPRGLDGSAVSHRIVGGRRSGTDARSPLTTGGGGGGESTTHSVVVAIIDNRAGEVGLAACDVHRGTLDLMQYGDDISLSKTLMQLTILHPIEILFPHTVAEGKLVSSVARHFSVSATFTAVHRREFNESKGAHRIAQLMSSAAAEATEVLHTDRYLCVAAAHALLTYVEATNGLTWVAGALRVRHKVLDCFLQLDRTTARGLCIIAPVGPKGSSGTIRRQHAPIGGSGGGSGCVAAPTAVAAAAGLTNGASSSSLAHAIDYTATAGGRRLLRLNVLQPLRDLTAIRMRHEAVAFLLHHRDGLVAFRNHLRRLAGDDMDTIVAAFASVPTAAAAGAGGGAAATQRAVLQLVALRHVLAVLSALVEAMDRYVGRMHSDPFTSVMGDSVAAAPKRRRTEGGADVPVDGAGDLHLDDRAAPQPPPVSHLLRSILDTLQLCGINDLLRHLDDHLDEDIVNGNALKETFGGDGGHNQRGSTTNGLGGPLGGGRKKPIGIALQVQGCFAVRPAVSSALDLARQTYAENMEAVFAHVDALRETHQLPSLKLCFDQQRHLHLSFHIQHDAIAPSDVFVRKYHHSKSRSVTCTTHHLMALKRSIVDALEDVANAQRSVVDLLVAHIRGHMAKLQAACDAVSLLDVTLSFALFALATNAVRPDIVDRGPILVTGLQHVLHNGGGAVVPSTIFLPVTQPIAVLSGPNASGKSTLLRAVGHAAVLAHIGCYIPAGSGRSSDASVSGGQPQQPTFRLLDRLLALVPERDEGHGSSSGGVAESSFYREMGSVAFACHVVTRSTLVLVDEIGRGTSTVEGAHVAHALVEWLADVRCVALVATHSTRLTLISHQLPLVQNQHMAVDVQQQQQQHKPKLVRPETSSSSSSSLVATNLTLRFRFVVQPGACQTQHYGIVLAQQLGVDARWMSRVPRIVEILEAADNDDGVRPAQQGVPSLEQDLAILKKLARAVVGRVAAAWGKQAAVALQQQDGVCDMLRRGRQLMLHTAAAAPGATDSTDPSLASSAWASELSALFATLSQRFESLLPLPHASACSRTVGLPDCHTPATAHRSAGLPLNQVPFPLHRQRPQPPQLLPSSAQQPQQQRLTTASTQCLSPLFSPS